jgi:hypothetical protein
MAALTFQISSRTITGSLGGKFLYCTMRPLQGGVVPPAGDFKIQPPVSDPIYGRIALMAPVGGSLILSAVSGKFFLKPDRTPGAGGGPVFVLSDRPVLGRNCIVVNSGYADLMDALQTSGGAMVTVA